MWVGDSKGKLDSNNMRNCSDYLMVKVQNKDTLGHNFLTNKLTAPCADKVIELISIFWAGTLNWWATVLTVFIPHTPKTWWLFWEFSYWKMTF
jgi:hypothetical protein